jgi:Fic family protein
MAIKPDLQEERLDARLRDAVPGAAGVLIGMVAEIDAFKGWWRGRFPSPPPFLAARRDRTVAVSALASLRIDWSGIPSPAFAPHRAVALPPAPVFEPGRSPGRTSELQRGRPAAAKALQPETRGTGAAEGIVGREDRGGSPAAPTAAEAGYASVLREVFGGHRAMVLGEELLFRLHAGLFQGFPRNRASAGRYRSPADRDRALPRRDIAAIALRPAEPEAVPAEMAALLRWTAERMVRGTIHPAFVAAGFVLEFLAIRPFADGNLRLSRILTNLLLLQGGYDYVPYASLDKAIADRKAEYYIALRKSQATRNMPRTDLLPWIRAFLEAMRAQVRELAPVVANRPDETLLSENQQRVLTLLRRHGEITTRLVVRDLGLPRETAKQILNRLLALNILSRAGSGRAVRYRRPDEA